MANAGSYVRDVPACEGDRLADSRYCPRGAADAVLTSFPRARSSSQPSTSGMSRRCATAGFRGEPSASLAVKEWVDALARLARSRREAKETSLEQLFNQKILGDALGYSLYPGADASAWPKAPTSVTNIAKEPDVMLGSFSLGN